MTAAVPADEWADGIPADIPAPPPQLIYPSVAAWLADFLAPTYRRSFGNGSHGTWCPSWFRHAEAVDRLRALWLAWEFLRLDAATGMAVWWRDYCDPAMAALTDTRGPFQACSPEGHGTPPPGLPLAVPPEGLFPG